MENTNEKVQEDQAQDAAVEIPKGRAMFLSMYKKNNPDVTDEPDDDSLFDYAGKAHSERDDYMEKYTGLNSANEKLAQTISEVPQLAKWVAMIANGENPWQALGEVIGDNAENLDKASVEKLHSGQEEFNNNMNRIKQNMQKYNDDLDKYVTDNGLTPEDKEEINNTIIDMINAFIDYDITEEIIDVVWKGRDYENQKTSELEAARVDAANKAIEEMKNNKRSTSPVPDLGTGGTGGKTAKKQIYAPKTMTMADAFKEKEV